jgi:hypothetical protein
MHDQQCTIISRNYESISPLTSFVSFESDVSIDNLGLQNIEFKNEHEDELRVYVILQSCTLEKKAG